MRDNAEPNRLIAADTAMGRDDIGEAVAGIPTMVRRWMSAQRTEVSGGQHLQPNSRGRPGRGGAFRS